MSAHTGVHRDAPTRISFSIAPDGGHAAFFTADGHAPLALEHWDLTGTEVRPRRLTRPGGETTFAQILALAGGQVLVTRPTRGVHHIALVTPAPDGLQERLLGTVESPGLRLLAAPDHATPALAVSNDGKSSGLWSVGPDGVRLLLRLAGRIGRTFWADPQGRRLGAVRKDGTSLATVIVDLDQKTVEPMSGLPAGAHVLLSSPKSGLLVLAATVDGAARLAHSSLERPGEVTVAHQLDRLDGTVLPVAVDPDGKRVALQVTRGAVSTLAVHTPDSFDVTELPLPDGTVQGTARWSANGLCVPFSTPSRPTTLLVADDTTGSWRHRFPAHAQDAETPWAGARLAKLPGKTGPVEAIVYGDGDLSRAERVVIALHGGPEAAWPFSFNAVFQRMSAAGLTVVAPNQRGSTGYGAAHREAIHGAWGGPDLDDICHLGDWLLQQRGKHVRPPALYGASYGAHLALLAAAARPALWERCAAVAPFLSGAALYEQASGAVRAMLDRLGGRAELSDDLGPRDLGRLSARITVPLLIVHGSEDDIIPVSHSRRLRDRLLSHGRRPGHDMSYQEVVGSGHDPLIGPHGEAVADGIVRFLAHGQLPEGGLP